MNASTKTSRPPLCIEYRPTASVRPDIRNARTHSKKQVSQIAVSIAAFGFTNPLLVDENGVLIAGHGRLLASKQLGMETVPVIVITGLSETEQRALRLADNKIALNSGWDASLVRIELEAITADVTFDVEITGFSVGEIDCSINGGAGDPDLDLQPELPQTPRTKLGDIWICGEHRIGCGDCRDAGFMGRVMGSSTLADVAFLDPPYNVRVKGHANVRAKHREFEMAAGEMTKAEFTAFLTAAFQACAGVSRDGAVHFACMDWRHIDELKAAGEVAYNALLNVCCWSKSNAGMGSLYRSKHELVFVYRVGAKTYFNAVELGRHGRHRTNVWEYPSVNVGGSRKHDLDLHPTPKPVAMVADAIQDVSRRGEVVLDAFLGSGTTLIAATRTGRRCRGVELDPVYVDVAINRWSALTGLEPILEPAPPSVASDPSSKGAWGQ